MTRVIIHAGFHKTGTTSLQRFLEINAEVLASHVRVILKPEMENVARCARDCSKVTGPRGRIFRPFVRTRFRRQFADLLHRTKLENGQILLISCEALVGRMPGRENVQAFDAAARLAQDMARVTENHFSSDLDLTFLYTTRDRKSWMHSAYSHLLHQSKFTMTEEDFVQQYSRAGDFEPIIAAITDTIAPHRLINSKLEQTAPEPFGPASDLIKLLTLPAEVVAGLEPAKRLNRKLTQFEQDRMKQINARDVEDSELNLMKRQFLRRRRKRAKRHQRPD